MIALRDHLLLILLLMGNLRPKAQPAHSGVPLAAGTRLNCPGSDDEL